MEVIKRLKVEQHHIDLLKLMYIDMNYGDGCGPGCNTKRPYGNSDICRDIANVLDYDDEDLTSEQYDVIWKVHEEMVCVLQILCDNCEDGIKLGVYESSEYDEWKYVGTNV